MRSPIIIKLKPGADTSGFTPTPPAAVSPSQRPGAEAIPAPMPASAPTHTPGPWDAIWGTSYLDEQKQWLVPGVAHCGSAECSEANARLIAAAPQMLEALRKIANGEGCYGAQAHEYKLIARAAVKLANGD